MVILLLSKCKYCRVIMFSNKNIYGDSKRCQSDHCNPYNAVHPPAPQRVNQKWTDQIELHIVGQIPGHTHTL